MGIPASGYASRPATNPGGALTDFTLMINLADVISDQPDFSTDWNTDTGGYGKATKGDGTTELATDWIDIDNAAETGWVRVKWSGTLASSGTQTVRLFPPNTANDLYSASDTYGSDNAYSSDWKGYWPLASDANNRTVNNLDLTEFNSPTVGAPGKVAGAYNFNGSNQYLEIDASPITARPLSMSLWVKTDLASPSGEEAIFFYGDLSASALWFTAEFDSNNLRIWGRNGPTFTSVDDDADQAWHHVVGTFYGSEPWPVELYIDGVLNGTSIASFVDVDISLFDRISIARRGDSSPGSYFDGSVDDVQLHGVRLSADWVAEEHSQTNDNAAFWGTWDWTAPGGNVYNVSIAESTGLSETQAINLTMPITIAESIGLSETQAITLDIPVTVSESIGLTDSQSVAIDMIVAIAESIGLSDTQSIGANTFDVSVSESIGLSDTQSATFIITVAVAEGIGLSDVQSTVMEYTVSIAETFGLTDIQTSGDLASGKVCVTISGSGPTITITGTATTITITGSAPSVDITGEGC